MPVFINSNISSISAQQSLNESRKTQFTAMERLSTGSRINSAKDDAAGLAIAENFTSQIRGLNQAVRNASDAYSLAQSAESGLEATTAILQRVRELAVQASSTTITTADRTAIQEEVDALTNEIDRIATTTQHNSNNILDGSGEDLSFQIGDKAGQTVGLTLESARAVDLGVSAGDAGAASGQLVGGVFSGTSPSAVDDVLVNGVNFASSLTAGVTENGEATTIAAGTAAALASQINTNSSQHGVTASAYTKIEGARASGVTTGALTLTVTDSSGINGGGTITISASSSLEELISNISAAYSFSAVRNANGGLDLISETGNSVVVGGNVTGTGLTAGTYHGAVSLSHIDGDEISITKGTNASAGLLDIINMGFNVTAGPQSKISGSNIQHHATDDFQILQSDMLTVNGVRISPTRTDKPNSSLDAADLAATINAVSEKTNVTATAKTEVQLQVNMESATTIAAKSGFIGINGVYTAVSPAQTVETVAANINTSMANAGRDVVASSEGSIITLTSQSGSNILVSDSITSTAEAFVLDGPVMGPQVRLNPTHPSSVPTSYTVAGQSIPSYAFDTAQAVSDRINTFTSTTGVTATAEAFAHFYSVSPDMKTADQFDINGQPITFDISATDISDAIAAINAVSGTTNVTATATTDNKVLLHQASGAGIFISSNGLNHPAETLYVQALGRDGLTGYPGMPASSIGGVAHSVQALIPGTVRLESKTAFTAEHVGSQFMSYLNTYSGIGPDNAPTQANANGSLLSAPITLAGNNKDNSGSAVTDIGHLESTFGGSITLSNEAGGEIVLGSDLSNDAVTRAKWAVFGLSPQGNQNGSYTVGVDFSSALGASSAITSVDNALEMVVAMRGGLGALMNRLEYSISNLIHTAENHSASRSRIADAKFAVEAATLAAAQVLAQASTAILAQANAAPLLVLELLQD